MRKIIQITTAYEPYDKLTNAGHQDRLFALCDDGTVWMHRWQTFDQPEMWERLADMPQDYDTDINSLT